MKCLHRTRPRAGRRGFALFLAILVLLVLTISGIALLFNTQIEQSLSSTETKISRSFYAADSGLAWATEQLRITGPAFRGGQMPQDVSANIPGMTADIHVNVTAPIMVGYAIHPGDSFAAAGSTYGPPQLAEGFFHLTSTSTSEQLQATKSVTTDVAIYPVQLHP